MYQVLHMHSATYSWDLSALYVSGCFLFQVGKWHQHFDKDLMSFFYSSLSWLFFTFYNYNLHGS